MKHTVFVPAILIILAVLFFSLHGIGHAVADEEERKTAVESQIESLAQTTEQYNSSVRVLIKLRDRSLSENTPEFAQTDDQKEIIEELQRRFISSIESISEDNITFRSTYTPFIGLTVTTEQLNDLKNNPAILSITEEKPEPLALAESTVQIGADVAWADGFTGSGQTVAILDTGIDKTHPMMTGKVVSEACYSTTASGVDYDTSALCPDGPDADTDPDTESLEVDSGRECSFPGCDHGTHVAGIAAGHDGSSRGVAYEADIISIQVFSENNLGGQPLSYASDQQKALERIYALRNTYTIASINMSLGGGGFYDNEQALCDSLNSGRKAVIDQLRAEGIATVIASGNDGYRDRISSPGCISTAYAVGSVLDSSAGTEDTISSFSNSNGMLDFWAPGQLITSAIPGGGYAAKNGTSMAAPHVAGAWALMNEKNPSWTVDEIATRLSETGVDITDPGNNITRPRIQVDYALSDNPVPTASLTPINPCNIFYTDVFTTNTFYNHIRNLTCSNVVSGYEDNTFKSDNPVSRGQMAKVIRKAFKIPNNTNCDDFSDVPTNHTFYTDITTLKCSGVINGFEDGTYKPHLNVTRGQAMKFTMQGLRVRENNNSYLQYTGNATPFSDIPTNHIFYEPIMAAQQNDIISGYKDGTFKPNNSTSRGEMSKIIDNARTK